ncbi:MAG: cytochrome c biogenesis protein [Candidatus Bathyarchaeota archaeon]|nr:cytochrome c biogenesis protein [Candidatus Bathyarchaeota archaeon]
MSNVAATLSSQNNHFSVSNPTYNIGSLPTGTATASWQITGTSAGTDQLIITVSAVNTHKNVYFTDSYSPNPSITVTQSTSPTQPTPTDNPTVTPTPTPTAPPNSNPTVQPTSNPSQTVTPHPTNTATSTPTATSQPTEPPTQTPAPTASPSNGNSTNHLSELNSNMLYIHPPLSIASYVFIFLLTGLIVKQGNKVGKWTKILGLSAWVLTVLGLVTGMIWAQIAWGSYWSWDLKEILTLALFLTLTVAQIAYFHGKQNISKWLLITASALVVVNILSTFIVSGLHSFA